MERKEEALAAIEALNGTMFKGRPLAVELSKAQPLINQLASAGGSSPGGTVVNISICQKYVNRAGKKKFNISFEIHPVSLLAV